MKKVLSVLAFILFNPWLFGETTITVSSVCDGSQTFPFDMSDPYGLSVSLYLHSDINIGSNILITKLGWNVLTTEPVTCPVKIYLKVTTSGSLSDNASWASLKSGSTLVFSGYLSFNTTGWNTIDIADFVYSGTNINNSLMVLCETDYGGDNGATISPSFCYHSASSKHLSWSGTDPPNSSTTLTLDTNWPNLQITYNSLSGVYPPSGFLALPVSSSQITLTWTKNPSNDNVMVAYNTVNTFGTPSGSYIVGSTIPGGGIVIYNGSGTTYNQTTSLNPNTTYYYMAWSVHSSPPTYSIGMNANATTFCAPIGMFPYVTDFESSTFPPSCWSLAGVQWEHYTSAGGYGNSTSSVKANFFSINWEQFDLISPQLDFSSMNEPVIKFDHAYTTKVSQVDHLELWTSNDNGVTYTLLTSWDGGPGGPLRTAPPTSILFVPTSSQWSTKRYVLADTSINRIMFRGVSAGGNNLYLDNITFYDTTCNVMPIPYSENFDHYTPPTTGCLAVTDNNGDGIKWIGTALYSRSSPNSISISHNNIHAMNDWFFTTGLNVTPGTNYALSFYFRGGGSPSVEKLEVKWGSAPDSAHMIHGPVWSNTNILNTAYANGYATFTPSSDQVYIGWHGFSAANMSFISVDDIHVDISTVTWTGDSSDSDDWNDPMNWSPSTIPNQYQNVIIPSGTNHDPVLYDTSPVCRNLTINSNASFTVNNGSAITIYGNLTVNSGAIFDNEGNVSLKGNLVNLTSN